MQIYVQYFKLTNLYDVKSYFCSSTLQSSFVRLQRAFNPPHGREKKIKTGHNIVY